MDIRKVSKPTLRRLPLYLRYLKNISPDVQYISSAQIANDFNYDPTQVRKDLASTGEIGTARKGFDVQSLINAIEKFLGWDNVNDAFIVGIGNLATALMGFNHFVQYGLNIVAGFDVDQSLIGKSINNKKVFHLEELTALVQRMHVKVGIITVPADYAQSVAELMVEGGIKAIWNFAPIELKLPSRVVVENVRLSTSLAVLTNKLKNL